MGVFSEFREFIARGNVVDLAVGVIIGAAFGKIVTSLLKTVSEAIVKVLVDQVVMPPIGMLLSGVDFSNLAIVLKPDDPATAASELVAIQYGALINAGLKFLIVAWVVFMIVKAVNAIRRAPPPADAPTAPPPQEALLIEIRDLLRRGASVPIPKFACACGGLRRTSESRRTLANLCF